MFLPSLPTAFTALMGMALSLRRLMRLVAVLPVFVPAVRTASNGTSLQRCLHRRVVSTLVHHLLWLL